MKIANFITLCSQALAISAASIPLAKTHTTVKRDGENWNAAAWSNFVKSYVDDAEQNAKRDENWNAAAWSNFVKSYVDDAEQNAKRDENWNAAAWSNFIKSYVDDFEENAKRDDNHSDLA